jgi:pimeloyl-ACP methyl ester carboxylesterase
LFVLGFAAAPAEPIIQAVDVGNGITLHYIEQGHGTPLIFVHGSISDGRYWNNQVAEFAKHYRVIAYSRRYNFPNTNPSRPGYSAITDADDLSALIKRLRLGKVDVVGHSYGALTTLFLAVRHPEQVRKIVLAEPPAVSLLNDLPGKEASIGHALYDDIQQRMVLPMQAEFRAGNVQAGVATFVDYVFNDVHAWEKFSPSSKQETLLDAHEWDVMMTAGTFFPKIDPAAIARIDVPVLIITGRKTYPFLWLIDSELARLIPRSKHFILPRDGHQMWYQDPVLCRETVEMFLRK